MFQLMQLPYNYEDLEPYIDSKTVNIHHSKHHQGYVNKLNEILKNHPEIYNPDLTKLILEKDSFPEDIKFGVYNNAGQVYNHNIYWESLNPKNNHDVSNFEVIISICKNFGSLENFLKELINTALNQFGSGWAWLSLDEQNNLILEKTSNADSPIVFGRKPLLTIDVWEHAYYLKYQNLRVDYLNEVVKILNWKEINNKYLKELNK